MLRENHSTVLPLQRGWNTKGRHRNKKTFSFGHCPNHLNLPLTLGDLVLFFGRQKRRFARMTEIFIDDDNDGLNDNYDDNFDDNYDKND